MCVEYTKRKKKADESQILLYNKSSAETFSHVSLYRKKIFSCEERTWNNPSIIVDNMKQLYELDALADEYVYMIAFDNSCKVLGIMEISHGGVKEAVCTPREVFQAALLMNATAIALIHNHPSGNCKPSENDQKLEKRLKEAGQIIGIELLDFIIAGENTYYSSHEN